MTPEIEVKQVTPEEWKKMAEDAHLSVFSENWDRELERIDFALIMVDKQINQIVSYATAQQVSASGVYLQYGGAFPNYKNTSMAFYSFQKMLSYLREKYRHISTLVENKNYPMLKFYMKENFLITGIRYFKGNTLLENKYETQG